ncbi:hypothetical protein [Candidatus Vidania fulgoroideorum]
MNYKKFFKVINLIDRKNLLSLLLKKLNKKFFLLLNFQYFFKRNNTKKITKKRNSVLLTGTGGDCKQYFNITSSVFIFISELLCFSNIVKYGSTSYSSKVGSSDFLQYSEQNVNFTRNLQVLNSVNVFKNVAFIKHIRKANKGITIFNFIFPFIDKLNSRYKIIGISNLAIHKFSKLVNSKNSNIMYLSGLDIIDEVSIYKITKITIIKNNMYNTYLINRKVIIGKNENHLKIKSLNDSFSAFKTSIIFENNDISKIFFINLYVSVKFLFKNKNIFFYIKHLAKYYLKTYLLNVKFFKRNNKRKIVRD